MIKKIVIFSILTIFCLTPVYAKKNKLVVYPNPWIPESGKSLTNKNDRMKHGAYTIDGWIKFKGVNAKGTDDCYGDLRIYDITGHLVKSKDWKISDEMNLPLPETYKNKEDRYHTVHWDGKNNDYEYVESGVYIWIIRENDGSKYDGKVVVVR